MSTTQPGGGPRTQTTQVPGEGEHKIMQHIRELRERGELGADTTHCMCAAAVACPSLRYRPPRVWSFANTSFLLICMYVYVHTASQQRGSYVSRSVSARVLLRNDISFNLRSKLRHRSSGSCRLEAIRRAARRRARARTHGGPRASNARPSASLPPPPPSRQVRPGRRPHHARARHARAALHAAARGHRLWRGAQARAAAGQGRPRRRPRGRGAEVDQGGHQAEPRRRLPAAARQPAARVRGARASRARARHTHARSTRIDARHARRERHATRQRADARHTSYLPGTSSSSRWRSGYSRC